MSSYTEDQEKIALDVLSKDKHAFYEILKVNRTANDSEIKKAYRKLAIKLHPDKNPHPKAAEAFKLINRAFEVLGNSEKREIFNRIGRDPDDRHVPSNAASESAFSSQSEHFPMNFENAFFRNRHAGAAAPEDIFDFLFNMNGGAGPFRQSPFMNNATTFSFGPGGFRAYNVPRNRYTPRQRQRQAQRQHDEEQKWQEIVRILLPLLFFFLLPILEKLIFG
ncbi:hypothetical protein KAFR_0B04890 [Kazachstania africana CBS 2517]|uniref:J domain-containing protein n=1 Tax=Kazachstania africana (strain ATCC 22294 / BCRC 22015 / CBS 2517 / CECT 1963 / NBRC 1671 / NRRL Y-8276) TaxID=1071382 RepID=H2AQY5_KAZAF|nr:hypothetical protein KAFR_0B04890 [Kazachstania africana CBS 2517]CCF56785.1 hypothetical protein KAFR_0B04890 [Kazachstania africana CBS 2517]